SQLVGGSGQPIEAFGRAEGLRRRDHRLMPPRVEIALEARRTAVERWDRPRLLPFDRGPVVVALLLVDPGQRLVDFREAGSLLEGFPIETERVGELARRGHRVPDQPQDEIGVGCRPLESFERAAGEAFVAPSQAVPGARARWGSIRELAELADGGTEAFE